MSSQPAGKHRRATYADLEAVPPNLVAEIIDGTLVTSPRPAGPHTHAASVLVMDLGSAFHRGRGGPGGWMILDEPELHLGPEPDVLVPDLAGWRRERMARVPEPVGITLPPDWVCEVLSPSTEAIDRTDKMPIYLREKVGHVWLVDPVLQTLEVFRLDGETWRLVSTHKGDAKVRAEPFDAIDLELAALWQR